MIRFNAIQSNCTNPLHQRLIMYLNKLVYASTTTCILMSCMIVNDMVAYHW